MPVTRFAAALAASTVAVASVFGSVATLAQDKPEKLTVISHRVHKVSNTEGPAGDVTEAWREKHGIDVEWITLDLNAIHDRLFREASLGESEVAVGFLLNTRAVPQVVPLFEPLAPYQEQEPIEDFDDIFGGFVEAVTFDDALYGVPYRHATNGFHYNAALFEERGLDGPPKTMAELESFARQLTFTRDDGTQVHGFAFQADNYTNVVNMAMAWDGGFISPDYEVQADGEGMVKTFAMLNRMFDDGVLPRNFTVQTQRDLIAMMQNGQVAMLYFPYGRTVLFNDPEQSKYAGSFKTAYPPVSEEKLAKGERVGSGEFWSMVIPANSKYKDLAWDFIRHIMAPENVVKSAINGNGPVRASAYEDETYKESVPYAEQEVETLKWVQIPLPPFEKSQQAKDIFVEEMQAAVLGLKSAEEAGTSIAERVKPLLPQ